jgi:hypothetical protein
MLLYKITKYHLKSVTHTSPSLLVYERAQVCKRSFNWIRYVGTRPLFGVLTLANTVSQRTFFFKCNWIIERIGGDGYSSNFPEHQHLSANPSFIPITLRQSNRSNPLPHPKAGPSCCSNRRVSIYTLKFLPFSLFPPNETFWSNQALDPVNHYFWNSDGLYKPKRCGVTKGISEVDKNGQTSCNGGDTVCEILPLAGTMRGTGSVMRAR